MPSGTVWSCPDRNTIRIPSRAFQHGYHIQHTDWYLTLWTVSGFSPDVQTALDGVWVVQTVPDGSGRFQTAPDGSGRFRTVPDGSGRLRTVPDGNWHDPSDVISFSKQYHILSYSWCSYTALLLTVPWRAKRTFLNLETLN